MTFTWILTPLPSEGSPQVTGSERGLTIASDSLADNADTLQGHPPRTRVSAAVPPPQGDCSPFHRPSPHSLAWAPANPFRDLQDHKQPRTTKNRLHEGRGSQAAGQLPMVPEQNQEQGGLQGPLKGIWGASTAYDLTLISPTRGFP